MARTPPLKRWLLTLSYELGRVPVVRVRILEVVALIISLSYYGYYTIDANSSSQFQVRQNETLINEVDRGLDELFQKINTGDMEQVRKLVAAMAALQLRDEVQRGGRIQERTRYITYTDLEKFYKNLRPHLERFQELPHLSTVNGVFNVAPIREEVSRARANLREPISDAITRIAHLKEEYSQEVRSTLITIAVIVFLYIVFWMVFSDVPLTYVYRQLFTSNVGDSEAVQQSSLDEEAEASTNGAVVRGKALLIWSLHARSSRVAAEVRANSKVFLFVGVSIGFLGVVIFLYMNGRLFCDVFPELFPSTCKQVREPGAGATTAKDLWGSYAGDILNLIPRVVIFIFIEVLAGFFLKQYRAAIREYRYFERVVRSRELAVLLWTTLATRGGIQRMVVESGTAPYWTPELFRAIAGEEISAANRKDEIPNDESNDIVDALRELKGLIKEVKLNQKSSKSKSDET